MLLDAGRGELALESLDVGADVDRLQRRQVVEVVARAPRRETLDRAEVGASGVGVADIGGEELDVALAGAGSGAGDQRRQAGGGEWNDGGGWHWKTWQRQFAHDNA